MPVTTSEGLAAVTYIQILSLLLGGGVLITLLRVVFLLGQYSQRVIMLEGALTELKDIMNEQRKEFGIVLREMQHELVELRRKV